MLFLLTLVVDENAHEHNVDDGEDAEDCQDSGTRICSVLTRVKLEIALHEDAECKE